MDKKLLAIVILFFALIFSIIKNDSKEDSIIKKDELVIGNYYPVSRIVVLKGDLFSFVLKDDERTKLLGKLPVTATEGSKSRVLDLLNDSESPRIKLLEKSEDGFWLIQLQARHNEEDLDLTNWLTKNSLVYK